VDLEGGIVRIGERSYPFRVLADKNGRAEIEVAGEKVVVDGWPEGLARPPGPLAVDGESLQVKLETVAEDATTTSAARLEPRPEARTNSTAPPERATSGAGTAILPPMPGRVVEVLVTEGAHVARGDVLLVLEAMKMRNEIPSPVAGTVSGLQVKPGTNVRAGEPMLRIVPDPAG
jgi:glutaconyl-CoA/methylmalonyl-CoA decarboxylase subunit gamma